ncbi:MAG: CCA tRNA nucleotidyltransferase [Candidatus Omnitrophica bacterium]|nr:CCA tRNA nucleotidyltransferase [Candidatus Omnitrophota bacterium]
MKKLELKRLPPDIYRLILDVGQYADAKGVPAFLVGGMVRDLILGRKSRDVDIVVEGDGILFAHGLAAKWRTQSRQPVKLLAHRKFGTAVLERADGLKLDIVTARRETYARPGSLPDVVPGLITDDLFRRDFTVNAVAVALNHGEFGVVYDNFDGCTDIKKKLIRVMHYRSFVDDPTRILRAVRYEKRFGFKFEPRTLSVLKMALEENAFRAITPVRYFGEFRRILQEEDPRPVLRRLSSLEGLRFFVYDQKVESKFSSIIKSAGKTGGPDHWISLFSALITSLDMESAEDLLVSFNMPRADKQKLLKRLS